MMILWHSQFRIPKNIWELLWETYHKGVPFLGVPENTLQILTKKKLLELQMPVFFATGIFAYGTSMAC